MSALIKRLSLAEREIDTLRAQRDELAVGLRTIVRMATGSACWNGVSSKAHDLFIDIERAASLALSKIDGDKA